MKTRTAIPQHEFNWGSEDFALVPETAQPVKVASAPVILAEMTPDERERWRAKQMESDAHAKLVERLNRENEAALDALGFEIKGAMPGLAPGSTWS